jgi:Tol biopolymer transport system component
VWLDRGGREVGAVGPPAPVDNPRLSPDGTRVGFELADPRKGRRDVWTWDLARGVRSRVTLDREDASTPVWSPDGTRLLIMSASGDAGLVSMQVRPADGSGGGTGIVQTDGVQLPLDWSSDGRWILFQDQVPARRPPTRLWLVRADGGGAPAPLEPRTVSQFDGRFSPDGRFVAFVSAETGRPEIIVAPRTAPGRRQQVSTEGGRAPRFRRDGRELFYYSLDGRMMAVPLGAGPDPEAGPPQALFSLAGHPGDIGSGAITAGIKYDVDARGERFLVNLAQAGPPPIVVSLGGPTARRD